MRICRYLAFAVLYLACGNAYALKTNAGKDERNFLSKCRDEPEGCAYTRIWIEPGQSYSRLEALVFKTQSKYWTRVLKESKDFWSSSFLCSDESSVEIRAHFVAHDGSSRPLELSKSRQGATCTTLIRSDQVSDLEIATGSELHIRILHDSITPLSGAISGHIPFKEGMANRFILSNNDQRPVSIDGLIIDGSVYRGLVPGGTVIDAGSDAKINGTALYFSTLSGWSEFARWYGKEEDIKRRRAPATRDGTSVGIEGGVRERVDRVISEISGKVNYRYESLNSGPYPRRTTNLIYESGFADCKDYALLLNEELERQGIASVSVMTGLGAPQPPSLTVPSYSWADHVVVWIPQVNMFIDMTAGKGHEIISPTSSAYGRLGFDVASGQPVIIK